MTPREFVINMFVAHNAKLATGKPIDGQCEWDGEGTRCTRPARVVLILSDGTRPIIMAMCGTHGKEIEAASREITKDPTAILG